MKKNIAVIINSIALVIILFSISACNALDLKPVDNYSINNYWNTEEQVSRYIHGLHYRLRSRATTMMQMGELRSGCFIQESVSSTGEGVSDIEITTNNLSEANPGITSWGNFYMDIYQINNAIDKLTTACEFLTDEERQTWLGQMYGMRAYYYFHMLRTWGGVPLSDKPDVLLTSDLAKLSKPRASEQDTWQFIRDDIDRSNACYKSLSYDHYKSDNCYWNKAATKCLLAEIYLWGAKVCPLGTKMVFSSTAKQDLDTAYTALLEVEKKYSMNGTFADAFSVDNKASNPETILALRYLYGESTNHFVNFTYNPSLFTKYLDKDGTKLNNPFNIASGGQRYEYSVDFYNSFNSSDTRRDATFLQYYQKDNEGKLYVVGRTLKKFLGSTQNSKVQYDNDIPVYRYTDVALMLAEILVEQDRGSEIGVWLNKVRARNYASIPSFKYTTKEAAEEEIFQERRFEFVGEAKSWYDARRMLGGKHALELVGGNEWKLVWPIDATVLSNDNLVEQNIGYIN